MGEAFRDVTIRVNIEAGTMPESPDWEEMANAANRYFDRLDDGFERQYAAAKKAAASMAPVGSVLGDITDQLQKFDDFDQFFDSVFDIGTETASSLDRLDGSLSSLATQLQDTAAAAQSFDDVRPQISAFAQELFKLLRIDPNIMSEAVRQSVDAMEKQFNSAKKSAVVSATDIANAMATAGAAASQLNTGTSAVDAFRQRNVATGIAVRDFATDVIDSYSQVSQKATDLETALAKVEGPLRAFTNELANGGDVSHVVSEVKNQVAEVLDDVTSEFSDKVQVFPEIMRLTWDGVADAVTPLRLTESPVSQIKREIDQLISTVDDASQLDDWALALTQAMVEMGHVDASGFGETLQQNLDDIQQKFADVHGLAVKEFPDVAFDALDDAAGNSASSLDEARQRVDKLRETLQRLIKTADNTSQLHQTIEELTHAMVDAGDIDVSQFADTYAAGLAAARKEFDAFHEAAAQSISPEGFRSIADAARGISDPIDNASETVERLTADLASAASSAVSFEEIRSKVEALTMELLSLTDVDPTAFADNLDAALEAAEEAFSEHADARAQAMEAALRKQVSQQSAAQQESVRVAREIQTKFFGATSQLVGAANSATQFASTLRLLGVVSDQELEKVGRDLAEISAIISGFGAGVQTVDSVNKGFKDIAEAAEQAQQMIDSGSDSVGLLQQGVAKLGPAANIASAALGPIGVALQAISIGFAAFELYKRFFESDLPQAVDVSRDSLDTLMKNVEAARQQYALLLEKIDLQNNLLRTQRQLQQDLEGPALTPEEILAQQQQDLFSAGRKANLQFDDFIAGLSDGQLSFTDLGGQPALQKAEADFRYFQDFIESQEFAGKSDFTKGEAYESAREAKALRDELRQAQARSDLFKVQLDVENLDDVYQKISTALGPEAAQKFGQEIADPLTAQFATITQQTSAAASQAESDAQSAIDQAKRELEDLQRNQERQEDQARTLTDMSFDQRSELDQKISNVTDRNSGLNALDAIQSSGIITADEALEVRRANSEITQEILREILKDKETAEEELQEYVKQRETLELTLAQKQEELKAITDLNQQILQQGRQYATEIENFRRALSQP